VALSFQVDGRQLCGAPVCFVRLRAILIVVWRLEEILQRQRFHWLRRMWALPWVTNLLLKFDLFPRVLCTLLVQWLWSMQGLGVNGVPREFRLVVAWLLHLIVWQLWLWGHCWLLSRLLLGPIVRGVPAPEL